MFNGSLKRILYKESSEKVRSKQIFIHLLYFHKLGIVPGEETSILLSFCLLVQMCFINTKPLAILSQMLLAVNEDRMENCFRNLMLSCYVYPILPKHEAEFLTSKTEYGHNNNTTMSIVHSK